MSRVLAAVFAGGFIGTIARVALAEAAPADPGQWPWATFAANVAGALALGFVASRLREREPAAPAFWGTGLCGALTTFSALQLELLQMLDGARYALASGYALASVAAGLAAVALGAALARRTRPLR